ncbi:MAG: DUF1643 domain-containing protein [Synechococcaceae cyanobacterium]
MGKPTCSPVDRHSLPEEPRLPPPGAIGTARFSRCGRYRWWLERCWWPQRPSVLFIGLNPSRADAGADDPTLRRLGCFARDWGFGGLEVVNLFSAVATDPRALRRLPDPVGGSTDRWIRHRAVAPRVQAIWLGWGNQGVWRQRDRQVLSLLSHVAPEKRLLALGATRHGQPRHPLYARAALPCQPWSPAPF